MKERGRRRKKEELVYTEKREIERKREKKGEKKKGEKKVISLGEKD